MYSRLGDQRRATENASRSIDEAGSCGDEVTRGKAHGLLSLEGHWSGKPAEGIEHEQLIPGRLGNHLEQRNRDVLPHHRRHLEHPGRAYYLLIGPSCVNPNRF